MFGYCLTLNVFTRLVTYSKIIGYDYTFLSSYILHSSGVVLTVEVLKKISDKRKQKFKIPIIFLSPGDSIIKPVSASLAVQTRLNQSGLRNLRNTVIHGKPMRRVRL